MIIRQKIFVILVALAMLLMILELVRRRKLKEEYSWMWLLVGGVVLLFALWYKALLIVRDFLGIVLPMNTLFFLGLVFVVLLCLHHSVKISQLSKQIKELTQKIAIMEGINEAGKK